MAETYHERNWRMATEKDKTEPIHTCDEPIGHTYICPRCGCPLDMVAEGETMELWECARCGYLKVLKGGRL